MLAAEWTGEFSVDDVFCGASHRCTGGSGRDSFVGDRLGCADISRQAALWFETMLRLVRIGLPRIRPQRQ